MQSLVCLMALVGSASAMLVNTGFVAFPESEPETFLTHEEIATKLASEHLEPAQTMLLLSSYGKNRHWPLIKDFYSYQFTMLASAWPDSCYNDVLLARGRICDELDEAKDDSVIHDNLSRFCRAANARVFEYCEGVRSQAPEPPSESYWR